MQSDAEIGLVEADDRLAEAERNIRQIGALLPELTGNGYATAEIESRLEMMARTLDHLHAQRRIIVDGLDGGMRVPRVVQSAGHRTPKSNGGAPERTGSVLGRWRTMHKRLTK